MDIKVDVIIFESFVCMNMFVLYRFRNFGVEIVGSILYMLRVKK